ncbi:MAG: hypothetical protein ACYC44_01555 [Patescibacteria group bacterium]
MTTKIRQPEDLPSPSPICSQCAQPILPGPEFEEEAKAGLHRRCFQRDVHQDYVSSQAHEIWLNVFGILYSNLPHPKTTLVALFKGYREPKTATVHGYIECLRTALSLVKNSTLSDDNKLTLTDKVNDALAAIKQLSADGAN